MVKYFLKSKTLWVNIIAGIATWLLDTYGFNLSAEAQVSILAVINIILRVL